MTNSLEKDGYKILIVEDEFIIAEDIKEKLIAFGYDVIGIVGSGREAIEIAKRKKPDLALMDIKLQGRMDGIEAASEVWGRFNVPVVFLTSFSDLRTLQRAKLAEPFGYIVKPFHDSSLRSNIEIALYRSKLNRPAEKRIAEDIVHRSSYDVRKPSQIFVRENSLLHKIKTEDIVWIQAIKDYMLIHTKKKNYYAHTTMKDLYTKLPGDQFMRVHRSYIVSLDKIDSIEENTLSVGEGLIPIGRSYRVSLIKNLNLV